MVTVTGSLTLGGYAYSTGGRGFTHAQLPGTNCTPGEPTTQFLLGFVDAPADSPWPIIEFGFIELWYMDRFVRDAFPMVPTSQGGGFQIRDGSRLFNVSASLDLQAVEQPAAVPEPGTLTLVGVGLAAVVRKIRRRGVTHH
jgi:hypothetical protein